MAVSSPHADYDRYRDDWKTLRDAFEGSSAIRRGEERYLPRPGGMKGSPDKSKLWQNYLARPEWLNATKRTVVGLTGCVFRKEPTISGLDRVPNLLQKNITGTGITLGNFMQQAFRETFHMGRAGILVDLPSEPQLTPEPIWALYHAESILNWRIEYRASGPVVTMVVLSEIREEPDVDEALSVESPDGEESTFFFNVNQVQQYRVLSLDTEGRYRVDIWREETVDGDKKEIVHIETLFPTHQGDFLSFIPFVFLGPNDLEPSIEPSPVWDLVRLNLRHWRHSADYEHGLHYTALPTPWITGHNPQHDEVENEGKDQPQIVLGSGEAIVLHEPEAKIGLLTLADSEFGALSKALGEDKTEMAMLGARLLEERPDVNETATAVRLRQSGDESILRTVANVVSSGGSKVLRWDAWWRGLSSDPDDEKINISLNTDFVSLRLSAQDLQALMQAAQAGHISEETLYWNLQQGEIAQPGVDFETEKARVEMNPPLAMRQIDLFGGGNNGGMA